MNLTGSGILFLGLIAVTIGQNAELDRLFEQYFNWRHEVYPATYRLDNGKMEDFSLSGIKAKIRKCVEFNEKVEDLKPEDSRYKFYKYAFKEQFFIV